VSAVAAGGAEVVIIQRELYQYAKHASVRDLLESHPFFKTFSKVRVRYRDRARVRRFTRISSLFQDLKQGHANLEILFLEASTRES